MPEFSLILTIISEEVYLSEVGFELNLLFVFEVQNRSVYPAKFSFEKWGMLNPNLNFHQYFLNGINRKNELK
jgi:hypothetical protein